MESVARRILPLARLLVKPNFACISARLKHYHPYEAPDWEHLHPREDSQGNKRWITYPDKNRWDYYNEVVWPPNHKERGESKKGEIFYCRERVKHPEYKLWFACHLVRNRPVDEAVKQLEFFGRKAAVLMRECLLEAQKQAVEQGKVEYKSDMYVAEAFARNSYTLKGFRRHARVRIGIIRYRYSDIFLRLEEGKPPENRSRFARFGGYNMMNEYVQKMRDRRILYGL